MALTNDFLQSSVIFLSAAVVAVPLAQRAGLGSVLGYLLAGVAIGPWGFGLISDVEEILHFSEFGVVLLLFLIGLELNPKKLWQMRGPILGLGGAQVVFTTILIALVANAFVDLHQPFIKHGKMTLAGLITLPFNLGKQGDNLAGGHPHL